MALSPAERQRRYRRRLRDGLVLVSGVEIPYLALEMLVEDGYLKLWDENDSRKVAEAVSKFLAANLW